ncbi:Signal peptidase complex subunit 3 [Balamuthia mandrillaris]
MHSVYSRLNSILSYAVFLLSALAVGNMITSFWLVGEPQVELHINTVTSMMSRNHNDYVWLTFDLDADLRPLWNWNTKQLFVFLTAEYKSAKNEVNQIVLWDRIIQTKEDSLLHLQKERIEYPLVDQGHHLLGNEVRFYFSWDITPITGILQKASKGEHLLTLPSDYIQSPIQL